MKLILVRRHLQLCLSFARTKQSCSLAALTIAFIHYEWNNKHINERRAATTLEYHYKSKQKFRIILSSLSKDPSAATSHIRRRCNRRWRQKCHFYANQWMHRKLLSSWLEDWSLNAILICQTMLRTLKIFVAWNRVCVFRYFNDFCSQKRIQNTTAYTTLLTISYHDITFNFNNVYNCVKQSKSFKIVLYYYYCKL